MSQNFTIPKEYRYPHHPLPRSSCSTTTTNAPQLCPRRCHPLHLRRCMAHPQHWKLPQTSPSTLSECLLHVRRSQREQGEIPFQLRAESARELYRKPAADVGGAIGWGPKMYAIAFDLWGMLSRWKILTDALGDEQIRSLARAWAQHGVWRGLRIPLGIVEEIRWRGRAESGGLGRRTCSSLVCSF